MPLGEGRIGLNVDLFGHLGKARETPRADGRRGALDGMGRLLPGLVDRRIAQLLEVVRHLVGEQVQHFMLDRRVAHGEACEISAIDGISRQLVARIGNGMRGAHKSGFSGQARFSPIHSQAAPCKQDHEKY
jgi:hypothetical protein